MPAKLKYPVSEGLKLCPECGHKKVCSEFSRSRQRLSSKCKSCVSAWAASYRQRPEVKARQRDYWRKYRSKPSNKARINDATRRWRKLPHTREKRNLARKAWVLREKIKAVAYKGGACVLCGYSRCTAALDFHHLNPKEKEGYGTGALKAHWTFEKNKPELDKCVLLCVRCHREVHAGAASLKTLCAPSGI